MFYPENERRCEMIRNKKGLSEVVTTLIIILLVLVAIGIIWVVVQGLIKTNTGQINLLAECPQLVISASTSDTDSPYTVSISRSDSTGKEITGYKFLVTGDTSATASGTATAVNTKTSFGSDDFEVTTSVTNPVKIDVYAELDSQLCPNPSDTIDL